MDLKTWRKITGCENDRQKALETLPGALANALDNAIYGAREIPSESQFNDGHYQLPGKQYIGFEFAKANLICTRDNGEKVYRHTWPGLADDSQYARSQELLDEIYQYLIAMAIKEVRGK